MKYVPRTLLCSFSRVFHTRMIKNRISRRRSCDIHIHVQGLEIHLKGFLIMTLEVVEWTASCDGRFNRGQNDFLLTDLKDNIRKRQRPIVKCSFVVEGEG
jgi:hypothetical protein